jgi:hypothetical protein
LANGGAAEGVPRGKIYKPSISLKPVNYRAVVQKPSINTRRYMVQMWSQIVLQDYESVEDNVDEGISELQVLNLDDEELLLVGKLLI